MVYIPPNTNVPKITAYLTTSLSPEDLATVKKAFELGACSRFCPILEMVIKDEPLYHNKSHADIRHAEDVAGRKEGFVVIDDCAVDDEAIWFIDTFATEDQVEDGEVESTDVLLKILIKTDCLPLTWINYDIANIDIMEDLGNCGVEMPLAMDYKQETPSNCGGLNMKEQQKHQSLWLTAEPGDFEESTDPDLLDNFRPRPDKVAKLYKQVAEEHGVVAEWTIPSAARPIELPDGTKKTFPQGSVVLQHKWNPKYPWPDYKWPDESL
ncbi:hypothetical protein CkaCkLH20_12888 [Colletotrichum karsti]|uniref:Uncharacterized protein n=1 Tax=Colletotrichum karsti TaxID=1095194 RepID=A0A9P6LE52_9PEZI|nr:uncharacterized protein CkaCkLH20_12888 [Colletotrichum karsti]KAF9869701.1 hypothetical protein CkaCkLH20_12888 [Colletotrichum karsti]